MTTPAAVPPPVESSNADEVIAALGALLIAGATVAAAKTLLGTLKGIAAPLVATIFTQRKLSGLLGKKLTAPGQKAAVSARLRDVAAREQARARAAYIVRCLQRLAPAYATKDPAIIAAARKREDAYLAAQGRAAADRQAALNGLIKAAGKRAPDAAGRLLLGWYLDDAANNCAACIAADGCNFDALDPPAIGWPGWVHPHCYCEAGAPHPTEVMVDDVVTQRAELPAEFRDFQLEPKYRASGLQATANGRKLWKWLTSAAGTAHFAGSPHPWQALVDFLISKGVSPGQAKGEATNIMMATAAGKALFAAGHKGSKKRSDTMTTETRAAVITEVRGPGTAKPDEPPGFTARMVPYGVPDSYRTSWRQGVFGPALEKRAAAGHSMPVVWNHDPGDPIGQVVAHRDEPDAFYADVEFDDLDAVPRAKQAHAQLRANAKTGKPTMGQFSFAFVRGEEEEDPQHRGVMLQTEVRAMHEFSVVLNGAVPGSGVVSTRTAGPAGMVDARTAADLFAKVAAGSLDLTDALLELRGATTSAAPAAKFEIRAVGDPDAGDAGDDPMAVLASVDAAMKTAAAGMDVEDVDEAKQFFSAAYSRLCDFMYLVGAVPGATFDGTTNAAGNRPMGSSYYSAPVGEQRAEAQEEEDPFVGLETGRRFTPPSLSAGLRSNRTTRAWL
jgi:phage head maturation protease